MLIYLVLLKAPLRLPPRRVGIGGFERPAATSADPRNPFFEHTEYQKSRSMWIFWTLNRPPVTTFAPVRVGKAEKCDPSEPGRANRTLRGPQKPIFAQTERPRSHSIRLFWTLNRPPVTTLAPVRAGNAEKCDPSEPARANRTPRVPPGSRKSTPAPLPLEYFTRLFLEW